MCYILNFNLLIESFDDSIDDFYFQFENCLQHEQDFPDP